jgi:hypothetical protein
MVRHFSIRHVSLGALVAAGIVAGSPAPALACTADAGMLAKPFEVGRFAFIGTLTRTTHGTEWAGPTSHAFRLERVLRGNLPRVLTVTVQDRCHSFEGALAVGDRVIVATSTLADLSVSSSLLWLELADGKLQIHGDLLNFPPAMRAPAEVMTEAEVLDYIGGLPDARLLKAETHVAVASPVDPTPPVEPWLPVIGAVAVVVISIVAFWLPRRAR